MNNRWIITMLFLIVITSITVISGDLFDDNGNSIKTHQFNYSNIATFNISNELTDKNGVESISFGGGISYEYPSTDGSDHGLISDLGALSSYGSSDWVESKQNDAYYKEIDSKPTSQGYDSYIFQVGDSEEYEVYIDLNNVTILQNGYESQYEYFHGSFKHLDEAKIFIETFKLNEKSVK